MFRLQATRLLRTALLQNPLSCRKSLLHTSQNPASVFSAFSGLFKGNVPDAATKEAEEGRYFKVVTAEEGQAHPEEAKSLKEIEAKLIITDELTTEAAGLRQQRREILSVIRDRMDIAQREKDRLEKYMAERQTYTQPYAGPDNGVILYFFRHIQNGKIFVSETQYMEEKEFHHQLGLKKFEAVVHYRPDHWEPVLAVTGLPYRRDVQRLKEFVLDPMKQEIPRPFRPLREKTGIKPHPIKKKARENLQYSKKSITRLNQGLAELQRDCNDLNDVKILWSRPTERNVLLRSGVDPEELEKPGEWVPFVKHDELQVAIGRKIKNIKEDMAWRLEKKLRKRLMRPMPRPDQPWYPLLGPGRRQFLAEQKAKTGKKKVLC